MAPKIAYYRQQQQGKRVAITKEVARKQGIKVNDYEEYFVDDKLHGQIVEFAEGRTWFVRLDIGHTIKIASKSFTEVG